MRRSLRALDNPTLSARDDAADDVDPGDSLTPVAHEAITLGEAALVAVRKTLDHWIAADAA